MLVQEEDDDIFSYNNFLKEFVNIPSNIKEMGIWTVISGNSEVTAVFGGSDVLNIYGEVFAFNDCQKLNNKRFSMVAKFFACPEDMPSLFPLGICFDVWYGNYVEKIKAKKDTKKDTKKPSAAIPNQEISIAQVIQKTRKDTAILLGKVASKKLRLLEQNIAWLDLQKKTETDTSKE